jgi:serine/threonine-protein kinase
VNKAKIPTEPEERAGAPSPALRSLGEYRLLRRLGQGGMGSVYLAYDKERRGQVALKVLSDQLASSADYVERFYREAQSGAHLDHPHIVRCISAGRDQATGKHYLVLEYVDGPNAHALIDRLGRLSVGDAVHVILDVARALEYAHSHNVVHRDIKPDNILITRSGVAKLADLGLAKRTDEESHLTALRQGFGSLFYIPCEQAFNAKHADARSDIYALGATLYHLVVGEVPFTGKSHMEIAEKKIQGRFTAASVLNSSVPPALDRILLKMMALNPSDRYQLVSEVIVDLERADLASAVPSFADANLALKDPLVQARLGTPKPTQLDLQSSIQRASASPSPTVWYLRYRNGDGRLCEAKLTEEKLTQRVRDGKVPKGLEAARQAAGEFHPISYYPEFGAPAKAEGRDGEVTPPVAEVDEPDSETSDVLSEPAPKSPIPIWVWMAAVLCVGLTLGLGALAVWLLRSP